jgi:hypothetical protein
MYRFAYCSLLSVVFIGLPAVVPSNSAAAERDATFRDLVFKSFETNEFDDLAQAVGQTGPLKQVIALEYKVLFLEDDEETAVDPKVRPFKMGDKIRLSIQPLKDSYIYIFHIGASGESRFLIPRSGRQPPLTKANDAVVLPRGRDWLEFVQPPGDEQLKVVAAEEPIPDLALLARVLTKDPKNYTEEEKQVRQRLNATVVANLRSVEEEEQARRKKLVTFRGIGSDVKKAADETRASGANKTLVEVPGEKASEGTIVVFVSTEPGDGVGSMKSSILVTIPLKSQRAPK